MSTKIIRLFIEAGDNAPWIKKQGLEKESLLSLDEVVNYDTYFKIKRNVFMNFSNRILFVITSAAIALFYFWYQYSGLNLSLFESKLFNTSVIVGILSNLGYFSLNAGIYFLPLKIGLVTSIPQNIRPIPQNFIIKFTKIDFHTKKARLYINNNYFKNLKIELTNPQQKLLCTLKNYHEAHNLAKVLAGQADVYGRPFIIKIENKRMSYLQYCRNTRITYFVDPDFYSDNSIVEIITGKPRLEINAKDLLEINLFLSNLEASDFIFAFGRKLATRYSHPDISLVQKGCIQMICALWQKKALIVIDRLWLDLNNEDLNYFINKIFDSDSAVVCFSEKKDTDFKYDKVIEISNEKI